jgi:molybdate transport system substrate-binding protein
MKSNLLYPSLIIGTFVMLLVPCCVFADAPDVLAFTAASLTGASDDLAAAFVEEYPDYSVIWNLAGTQDLKTQVENGALPDVFISASARYTREMTEDGWFVEDTVHNLASNWIIVILPKDNPANIVSLADLANPDVMIAMGTDAVPVGINTRLAIDKIAELDEFGEEWKDAVFENTVTYEVSEPGVVEKVVLGEVDAGFVYQSSYSASQDALMALEIAEEQNEIQYYSIAILLEATNPDGAIDFVDFLLGEVGQGILADFGFTPAS